MVRNPWYVGFFCTLPEFRLGWVLHPANSLKNVLNRQEITWSVCKKKNSTRNSIWGRIYSNFSKIKSVPLNLIAFCSGFLYKSTCHFRGISKSSLLESIDFWSNLQKIYHGRPRGSYVMPLAGFGHDIWIKMKNEHIFVFDEKKIGWTFWNHIF